MDSNCCIQQSSSSGLGLCLSTQNLQEDWGSKNVIDGNLQLQLNIYSRLAAHKRCLGVKWIYGIYIRSKVFGGFHNLEKTHPGIGERLLKSGISKQKAKIQGPRLHLLLDSTPLLVDINAFKVLQMNLPWHRLPGIDSIPPGIPYAFGG